MSVLGQKCLIPGTITFVKKMVLGPPYHVERFNPEKK